MKKDCFGGPGQWYKGNLHSHTTNSDGHLTPAQAVALFRQYGYSFLCLSEHDYYTDLRAELDRDDFILLPGVEASSWLVQLPSDPAALQELAALKEKNASMPELVQFCRTHGAGLRKTHHIHGILGNEAMQKAAGDNVLHHGERLTPPVAVGDWDGLQAAQQLTDYLKSRGCFTTYNHPTWSRVEMADVVGLQGAWAVEVYNYGTEVECGEGYDTVFWNAMLQKGTQVGCFASDDNHNPAKFFDALGGWVCVKSEELTHEAIVNHLLAGDYYASSGPEIMRWGVDGNEVYLECSPAARINFIAGGLVGGSETILEHESPLTHGLHTLHGGESWIRVEVIDHQGRHAWTNPIWL